MFLAHPHLRHHPCPGPSQRVPGRDRAERPHVTGRKSATASGPFLATAEHLLLPGLHPELHFPTWASCPVSLGGCPPGTRGRLSLQSTALTGTLSRVSSEVTVSPTHDLPTVLIQLELALSVAPTTQHLPRTSTTFPRLLPEQGLRRPVTSLPCFLGHSDSFFSVFC